MTGPPHAIALARTTVEGHGVSCRASAKSSQLHVASSRESDMIGGVLCLTGAVAAASTDWAIAVPLVAAILGAALAYGWNLALKRRDEKRELRALVRLLDDELASLQGALEAR